MTIRTNNQFQLVVEWTALFFDQIIDSSHFEDHSNCQQDAEPFKRSLSWLCVVHFIAWHYSYFKWHQGSRIKEVRCCWQQIVSSSLNWNKQKYLIFKIPATFLRLCKSLSAIVWFGSISICTLLAIIITAWVWQRWEHTPTLTTVDTYYYPISKVPFPAVTLCNINIVYRSTMENQFLKRMWVKQSLFVTLVNVWFRSFVLNCKSEMRLDIMSPLLEMCLVFWIHWCGRER